MTKEELILSIMAEAEKDGEPLTRAEAEEVAEMEIKAKGIKNYTQAEVTKPKAKREPKIDEDKVVLIDYLKSGLFIRTTETGGISNLEVANPQKEITFSYNGSEYSVTLTKHRPKK